MEIKNLAQQYIYWPEIENTYQKNIDFSQTAVLDLKDLIDGEKNGKKVSIENTIIKFYALNEILAKLRIQEKELLNDQTLDLYKQYVDEIETTSKKLFSYMFYISLAECRHCYEIQGIRNASDILDEQDYMKKNEYKEIIENQYSVVLKKNKNKYNAKREQLTTKYGANLKYDYENPLYNNYMEDLRKIEVHYNHVKSRINTYINNLADKYSQDLEDTKKERLEAYHIEQNTELTAKFAVSEETIINNESRGELISANQVTKFLQLFTKLSTLGSGRSAIYKNLMNVLEEESFKDITIEDMFKCVINLFTYGNFSSSYGGLPWANITSHALNFAKGNINAEVFLDQAFSLEHNNGNMFNKTIVFNNAHNAEWTTYVVIPKENNYTPLDYSINNCQILLNAQHQGQLLSLLGIDHDSLYRNKDINTLSKNVTAHIKSGLLPKETDLECIRDVSHNIEKNLNNIYELANEFHVANPQFKNVLSSFKVETPMFDIGVILNGCKGNNSNVVKIEEKHGFFNNLTIYQLNKYTNVIESNTNNTMPYEFSFEYLNTKNMPEVKLKKEFLGNKAYGLAQMHSMDLPVPSALVFPTTNASGYFNEKAKWLNSLRPQLNKIKDYFTDNQGNPIACSVRSGSSISMPGMMDTILNVGIDNSNYDYFCKKMGKEVTNECVVKFMSLFSKSLFNEDIKFSNTFAKAVFQFRDVLNRHGVAQDYEGQFPLNARQQYKWCLEAVFKSWHSERAIAYRNHQRLDHNLGTAAIVQQMVFGNLNEHSCTGVVFSRDCISGEKGIIGEFLPKAQGEDVVSGAVTPLNIKQLKDFNPVIYQELLDICERLEKDTRDIQDIEFTVEDGKLYILQKRKAVCSSLAQTKLNQELFENGLITEEKMLSSINVDSLISKEIVDTGSKKAQLSGLIGNPGVMRGIVIHCQEDMIKYADLFKENSRDTHFGWIFYAPETSPDHAPIMIKTQAFITSNGGFTSHAAILSRSWDKPCIVGVGNNENNLLEAGSVITMDANNGNIYKDILPLKEGSKKEVDNLVNRILVHYKVSLEDLNNENSLNSVVTEVNKRKSWMESYTHTAKQENQPIKHKQFLALGHKVALMLVKLKTDKNSKAIEENPESNINNFNSIDNNISVKARI